MAPRLEDEGCHHQGPTTLPQMSAHRVLRTTDSSLPDVPRVSLLRILAGRRERAGISSPRVSRLHQLAHRGGSPVYVVDPAYPGVVRLSLLYRGRVLRCREGRQPVAPPEAPLVARSPDLERVGLPGVLVEMAHRPRPGVFVARFPDGLTSLSFSNQIWPHQPISRTRRELARVRWKLGA